VIAAEFVSVEESPYSTGHKTGEIPGRGNLPVGPQKHTARKGKGEKVV